MKSHTLQAVQTLKRISRILWVRVALITALAVLAAFSAELVEHVLPDGPKDRFSSSAILPILTILANGMLAVATFSLGVMVSSHRTLAEQSTPRIHRLLMEDTSTQSMLATFIGAFVFSLFAIILFRAGYYSEGAGVAVFAATVFVVLAVVVSLVRWIGQLTRIGSLEYALDQAEAAAREVLRETAERPALGAMAWGDGEELPSGAREIRASSSGFLTRIDMEELQSKAAEADALIYLKARPGDQILESDTVGYCVNGRSTVDPAPLAEAFILDASRSVDQDPRYALIILREAASKALSPGINDQGTAIEVIARLERLLWAYDLKRSSTSKDRAEPLYPNVRVKVLPDRLFAIYAFRILARDGAGSTEVLIALARAIGRLPKGEKVLCAETRKSLLADIEGHGMRGVQTERERERLRRVLRKVAEEPRGSTDR